jgi:hypothetical protein
LLCLLLKGCGSGRSKFVCSSQQCPSVVPKQRYVTPLDERWENHQTS